MNRIKRFTIVLAATFLFVLSTTSCHREGCPNSFGQIEEHSAVEVC